MRRSFYQFLMTHRNTQTKNPTEIEEFAQRVYQDISFPIHSSDYEEVSTHLELSGLIPNMRIFDEAWEEYVERS